MNREGVKLVQNRKSPQATACRDYYMFFGEQPIDYCLKSNKLNSTYRLELLA